VPAVRDAAGCSADRGALTMKSRYCKFCLPAPNTAQGLCWEHARFLIWAWAAVDAIFGKEKKR
jgi:hypothetical protein